MDYKPLNKVIKIDCYPIASVTNLYAKLGQSEFFSKIIISAYHQVPIHPDLIELTAFICEFGLFEYLSMPMGISSAPAWFQRFIDITLRDFVAKDALNVYMDDIIIFTKDIETHEADVYAVMALLKEKNIKTSFSKSKLVTRQIEFLGNIIEGGEIRTHPNKLPA